MKACSIILSLVISLAQVFFAEDADTAQSLEAAPTIFFMETVYNFDTTPEGENVVHTFVVENTGNMPLEIEKIKTSCGCATAEYTKEGIPPGGKGEVTLQVNTKGYGGRTITKSAMVYSNDPKSKGVKLKMVGKVAVFADVSPKSIKLVGAPGEKIRAVVKIVPGETFPFHIVGKPETGRDTYRCTLEEKGGVYLLTAENLAKDDTVYFDTVVLKTDQPEHPEIKIQVFGRIKSESRKEQGE